VLEQRPSTSGPTDISRHAVGGTLWTYLSLISGRLLAFASSVLLARLLVPEHFGLMSYCLLAVQYVEIFSTFGLDAALIARRDRFEQAANASFFISLSFSVVLYGVSWVIAPVIASFFDAPDVTHLFRTLALVIPIGSLDLVHNAMVQRQLRFKNNLVPEISATVVKSTLSVYLAWRGFGVWSLVYGHVAGEVITTLAYWLVARWRPHLDFDARVTPELLVYGVNMVGVGVVGVVLVNVDYILVGRILGTTALGFYSLGYRIPELVIRNFGFVVGKVGLPILARVQWNLGELRVTYLKYLRYIALFTFPAGVGIALTAHLFVPVLYTAKWLPAVPVVQIIAIALAIASISYLPGVLYKAVNRPQILARLALFKAPFAVTVLWVSTRWGISGVAMGQLLVVLFAVSLDSYMARRVIRVGFRDMLHAILPALVGTATMALVDGAVILLIGPTGLGGLLLLSILGIVVYFGCLLLVDRESVTRAVRIVSRVLRRQGDEDPSTEAKPRAGTAGATAVQSGERHD
jgi:O-antigen/teichoic acid export membrane protein